MDFDDHMIAARICDLLHQFGGIDPAPEIFDACLKRGISPEQAAAAAITEMVREIILAPTR